MGDEGGKDSPKKELSLETAKKIVHDLAETPIERVVSKNTLGDFIGPLEQKAIGVVGMSIVHLERGITEDRFTSLKTHPNYPKEGVLVLDVAVRDLVSKFPMHVGLLMHGVNNRRAIALLLPLWNPPGVTEMDRVDYEFRTRFYGGLLSEQMDKPRMTELTRGILWGLKNIDRWAERDLIFPDPPGTPV